MPGPRQRLVAAHPYSDILSAPQAPRVIPVLGSMSSAAVELTSLQDTVSISFETAPRCAVVDISVNFTQHEIRAGVDGEPLRIVVCARVWVVALFLCLSLSLSLCLSVSLSLSRSLAPHV